MNKYPFILIFDIDNTVIGDVKLLHQEAQLLEYIYNTCKKEKIGKCKLIENINMQKELKTGMLRPYIKEFIKFCDSKFKNVEIFFYTGSPYKWTNTSLGSNIEKVLNIKINRPFFTRENMIRTTKGVEKSLANIVPYIVKTLESRYPIMHREKELDYIIKNRTIFIDDVKNNTYTYESRQIICPKYNYRPPMYDVSNKFIKTYNIDPKIFNNKEVLNYMWNNNIYIYNTNGNIYQKNRDYCNIQRMLDMKYSKLSKTNDRYYKDLIRELSKQSVKPGVISDKNIININEKLTNIDYSKK
jgi:hypothetical protein